MDKDARILIVGAGVFGLSTALHLTKRGYTNIHIFDLQPYDKNDYKCSEGCDAASADENKIIRASYGGSKLYQDLAFSAMPEWRRWNEIFAASEQNDGLEALFYQCGLLRLSEHGLEPWERKTQSNFPEELKGTQYRVSDPQRREDALSDGVVASKIDPFARIEKELPTDGYLDMTAGYVLASRACAFALHLCQEAGVQTYLGPEYGMKELIRRGGKVTGIVTQDGSSHSADLVVVACGGWTPSLLPEIEQLIETTARSVLSFRLPAKREDLWNEYSSDSFPAWCWNMTTYDHDNNPLGGIFGFPRTPEGVIKICFTGAQWTDYTHRSTSSGQEISYPKTDGDQVPEEAMKALHTFCAENMPDLLGLEPETLRMCWYSDSVDGSFLIDFVPETDGLMVCNGGSGHGFKFLPVLGQHAVDVVEGKDTEFTRLFAWRGVPQGKRNGLEEGPDGWRTLGRQRMVGREGWRMRT